MSSPLQEEQISIEENSGDAAVATVSPPTTTEGEEQQHEEEQQHLEEHHSEYDENLPSGTTDETMSNHHHEEEEHHQQQQHEETRLTSPNSMEYISRESSNNEESEHDSQHSQHQTSNNTNINNSTAMSSNNPSNPSLQNNTNSLSTTANKKLPTSSVKASRGFGSTSSLSAKGSHNARKSSEVTSPQILSSVTSVQHSEKNFKVHDNISPLSNFKSSLVDGLSTSEAKQNLFDSLEETIEKIENRSKQGFIMALVDVLIRKSPIRAGLLVLLGFVCCILLYIAAGLKFGGIPFEDHYGAIRLVVEATILLFVLIFFLSVTLISYYRRHSVVISLLKQKFSILKKNDFNFSMKSKDGNLFEGINMIPYKMIFVFRDKCWSKMPHILLVKGDLVYSTNIDRDFKDNNISFEAHQELEKGFYKISLTPMSHYIEETYEDYRNQQEKMPLKIKLNNLISVLTIVSYLGYCIALICNLIRIGVGSASYDWVTFAFVEPCYVCLVLLPIAFPGFWLLSLSFSNSKLLSLFETLNEPLHGESGDDHMKRVQVTESNRNTPMKVPFLSQVRNFFKVILTANASYYDNLTVLGTITALCFINRTGLLADLLYAPEKVLFMKGDDERHNNFTSAVDISEEQYTEQNSKYASTRDRRNSTPSQIVSCTNNYPEDLTDATEMELKDMEKIKVVVKTGMGDEVDEMVGGINVNDEVIPSEVTITVERPEDETINHHHHQHSQSHTHNKERHEHHTETHQASESSHAANPLDVSNMQIIEKAEETITLDVLFDRTASREVDVIRFTDPNWMVHTNSLKPLGLSLLITGSSPLPDFDRVEGMLDAKSHLWKKYAYLLGKEIGFSDSVLESFTFKKRLHTQCNNWEMSSIVVEYEEQEKQVHSFGDPDLVLEYCSDYYSGTDIKPLSKQFKENILETVKNWRERRDLYCLAISYTPIDPKYDNVLNSNKDDIINITRQEINHSKTELNGIISPASLSQHLLTPLEEFSEEDFDSEKFILHAEQMQRGQILLGVAAFRQQPKRDLAEFISDVQDNSGIRFIHFSPYNSQKTKAFGSKLGMEVDWNCCISLNDNEVELDVEDLKAKLPHGIENIKEHLKTVDDVPLLVSLFSDSTPVSSKQMIEVLQENHEVVCCVGSSININNSRAFNQANISIAVDPCTQQHLRPMEFDNHQEEVSDLQEDISPFLSYPCALHITSHQSETALSAFSMILHMIKEGRRLVHNIRQALIFLFGCSSSLFILQLLSVLMALPSTIFTGIQFLWLCMIAIPLISFSLLGTPMEPKIMDLISSKNEFRTGRYVGKALLTFLRFCLPVPACFVVYFWTIMCMDETVKIDNVGLIWGDQLSNEIRKSEKFYFVLAYAQTITMFILIYYYSFLSLGTMHRVYSIFTVKFFMNIMWWICVPLCLALQALFTFIHLIISRPEGVQAWPNYPFYAYIIILLAPFAFIVIDELIKIRIRSSFFRKQQKAKLMFDTKLGMYSPK
ncbi:predicted protein [Naegleria gruberi]|uniref:Predicted protein n=1 Tax=Naegleria gruberi TaxID=5762 RepID=D2VC69_NAEGR|nr:uncharacterized protein NAEGRDRAFT_66466 [Naegleria gruberi]EFC45696.1 predicted protein [Naegleria gruberi]|eukprot:XP_002678440.1 predicted protein [Naegleria gruberi strain NEG-M]